MSDETTDVPWGRAGSGAEPRGDGREPPSGGPRARASRSPVAAARAGRGGWAGELRATLALGLPLIAAQLAQIAINATDTLMMGRLGPQWLAAGVLGTTLLFLFIIVQIGLSAAVGTLIAQARGARPNAVREPRRIVRQGFWVVSILAAVAMLALTQGAAILRAAGQDPALAATAMDYIRPALWAMPFAGLFVVLRAFVMALERTRELLIIIIAAIGLNAALNFVLMFGKLGMPALGIAGTGIATTVANGFQFVALALVVTRDPRMRRYAVFGRFWRADPSRFLAIVKLGVPIALLLLAEVGAFSGSTALAGMVGTQTLAAHAIALQIGAITFMIPLGLSQATNVRVGLAYGRGHGVALAGHVSLVLGLGVAAHAALAMLLAPDLLVAAFIDARTASRTAALAASFLLVAALFQLVDAGQVVLASALRGTGDTTVPLVMGVFGYWVVGLPLGAALAFGWLGEPMGGTGVWIGLASGLASVCVLLGWRWTARLRAIRAERGAGA